VAPDTGEVAALHRTFLRLEGAASAAMDSAPADTAPAAEPADTPQTPATPESTAAAAVQKTVMDVHAAWSAGDLDRMMTGYANRVDYYGMENASRSFVRGKVADTIKRYDRRKITINRQATIMVRPDLARVLVDKEWDFTGRRERWYGSMRQELMMRNENGSWKIVSERAAQIFNEKHQKL
jgi:ketosteroid isomerase-like protein